MARPYARSNAEAHLYMDLHPCPACGERDFDRRSAVINDAGTLCSRYTGPCARCGAPRTFVFELPDAIRPVHADYVEYGGDDPSRIIDPGEWLAVAAAHARRGRRRDWDIARAAITEVRKFLPAGLHGRPLDRVPDEAFWTARGRAVRDADPDAFTQIQLATALEHHRRMASEAADGEPGALVEYPPVGDAPAPGSLPAQIAALATAIAAQHGFTDDDLRRHATYLTDELTRVARRFEIRAREDRARIAAAADAARLIDRMIGAGGPESHQLALHRNTIVASLRQVDLPRLTESLQVLVDWFQDPADGRPFEDMIANLQSAVTAIAEPRSQTKPTAPAETKPTASEKSEAPRSLQQMFPGTRKDPN